MPQSESTKASPPLLIAAAWALVLLPTLWGLRYTVENALRIFTKPTATTTTPPSKTAP